MAMIAMSRCSGKSGRRAFGCRARDIGGISFFGYLRVGLPLAVVTTLFGVLWMTLVPSGQATGPRTGSQTQEITSKPQHHPRVLRDLGDRIGQMGSTVTDVDAHPLAVFSRRAQRLAHRKAEEQLQLTARPALGQQAQGRHRERDIMGGHGHMRGTTREHPHDTLEAHPRIPAGIVGELAFDDSHGKTELGGPRGVRLAALPAARQGVATRKPGAKTRRESRHRFAGTIGGVRIQASKWMRIRLAAARSASSSSKVSENPASVAYRPDAESGREPPRDDSDA